MKSDYEPISCAFYDLLEATAVRGEKVTIVFEADGDTHEVLARVLDLFTKAGVEYATLSTGDTLRLDQLIRLGDAELQGAPLCSI